MIDHFVPEILLHETREELIARIEELNDEIETLEEKQNWVSSEERLPDYSVKVLVYDSSDNKIHTGWFAKLVYSWETSSGLFYHGDTFKDITHWMPLPQTPVTK